MKIYFSQMQNAKYNKRKKMEWKSIDLHLASRCMNHRAKWYKWDFARMSNLQSNLCFMKLMQLFEVIIVHKCWICNENLFKSLKKVVEINWARTANLDDKRLSLNKCKHEKLPLPKKISEVRFDSRTYVTVS